MEWLSNFGMREWLILCGVVLVMVVLVDGYRRMLRERKGEIRMARKLGGSFPETSDADELGSELPNGGARAIYREEPSIAEEPVEGLAVAAAVESTRDDGFRASFHESLDSQREGLADSPQASFNSSSVMDNTDATVGSHISNTQILVMHAKSKAEGGFNGSDLLQVLLACDLRYGDRDILHRHERAEGDGSPQFSVANMMEPGTFNLEDINSFRTPGVTFFMTLPGAKEPEQAFDCMVETANCLVKNLNAYLLDDNHDALTTKGITNYRNRVKQFVKQTQACSA